MKKCAVGLCLTGIFLSACTFPFNQTYPSNPLCPQPADPPTFVECVEYTTRDHEIRYRTFPYDLDRLADDYREEHRYLVERRQLRLKTSTPTLDNLSGIAMSGGGIRSASFQLGVLQALVKIRMGETTLFDRLDYMSSVSGGSYIAGWVQAHLGHVKEVDARGWMIRTDDPQSLLADQDDFVQHLRTHAGFLREGGFWEGPRIIWSWLWRWPFSLVWDVGLHVMSVPPVGNAVHQVHPYRDRIAGTYLRGRAAAPLAPLPGDGDSHIPPYVIINGNLVNDGAQPGVREASWRASYNFEFTRDFTGSDGLGYVETKAFGWPVRDLKPDSGMPTRIKIKVPNQIKIVYPELRRVAVENLYTNQNESVGEGQGAHEVDRIIEREDVVGVGKSHKIVMRDEEQDENITLLVTVRDPCEMYPHIAAMDPNQQSRVHALQSKIKIREIGPPCFRLADAVMVSSAAFDVKLQLLETVGDNKAIRLPLQKLASLFNLNYVHQTWNFTQGTANVPKSIWDNFGMVTYKRLLWPSNTDPWIELADGALFDNLAAFALVRRGVQHVIVSDATYDPTWTYYYLKRLRDLVNGTAETKHGIPAKQMKWCDTEFPEDHEIVWSRKFWVKRADNTYSVIHYLKPYAYNPDDLFSENKTLLKAGHGSAPFVGNHPGDLFDPKFPHYQKAKHLNAEKPPDVTDDPKEWRKLTIQVSDFAKSGNAHGFPQTTSWLQWYEVEEFEAYRRLGYLMGKAYLSGLKFDVAELQPPAGC